MRNLSSDERYLHKAAVAIAKLVQVVVKQNPRIGMGLMSTLTGKLGRPDFDRATRTKTVESIMGSLDVAGLQQYVDHLCRLFVSSNGDERCVMLAFRKRCFFGSRKTVAKNSGCG